MLQLDTTDNYYMTVKYPVGQNKQTNKQTNKDLYDYKSLNTYII
jgi:hypothetical protein